VSVTLRAATRDDAAALGAIVAEAFEGYRSFAPPGWEPPPPERELVYIRDRLADPGTFCVVAEVDGEVAGHVGFFDAALARRPERERGLAHFWQLFVRPRHQGTGVAAALMDAAVAAASDRGFHTMRLFTPALQSRARRFYEREGWVATSEPEPHPDMGLDIVEYRLRVPRADRDGGA
jgi:GNAT superfamily N-acetyltransferase